MPSEPTCWWFGTICISGVGVKNGVHGRAGLLEQVVQKPLKVRPPPASLSFLTLLPSKGSTSSSIPITSASFGALGI